MFVCHEIDIYASKDIVLAILLEMYVQLKNKETYIYVDFCQYSFVPLFSFAFATNNFGVRKRVEFS